MKLSIEPVKSLITMFLFALSFALLLTKFYYLPHLMESSTSYRSITLDYAWENTVEPNYIICYLGGNKITKMFDTKAESYGKLRSLIRENISSSEKGSFHPGETLSSSKNERGIEILFRPSVDAKLLSGSIFNDTERLRGLRTVSRIYLSSIQNKPLFFEGDEGLIEFSIQKREINQLLENIQSSPYVGYYSLNYLFESSSPAFVNQDEIGHFPVYNTKSSLGHDSREEIARRLFGQQFDFLSEITETDGRYIYSYNYGKKVFKTTPNGMMEYTNENFKVAKYDLKEQFHVAVDFLKMLNYDIPSLRLYGHRYVKVHGNDATKFIFKRMFNGLEIDSSGNSCNIEVTLVGEDVYKFRGQARNFSGLDLKYDSQTIPGLNALESLYIYSKKKNPSLDATSYFNSIADFTVSYFMNENKDLLPCYKITIDRRNYYIDIYTGEVIANELEPS
ncbi:hypothetical protein [Filifactor villosus]|uniref:Regulatory protein YycH domain-containing protein n=1 Tax=Filifactor villosus TaxID=29374 RepID=A0ABV9QJ42_9FIRM